MTPGPETWAVRIAATADADLAEILQWTAEHFGAMQARIYAGTLAAAIAALSAGPSLAGARRRDDIARGVFTLHVARDGRKGSHFVIFRVNRARNSRAIDVLRALHDSMDLPRHLP